ncbi:MAG: hypothetical protein H6Q33_2522 [Deltaproteobacteria bacterium]|nr:hypothetical protein [Deltaproteobacteria bacterium]
MLRIFWRHLCLLFLLTTVSAAAAESPLNANTTMRDNLVAAMATKKPVTVVLKNGQSYRGPIGSVGNHLVVLNGPAQKEFYDVLVTIDEIVAIEFRVRDQ